MQTYVRKSSFNFLSCAIIKVKQRDDTYLFAKFSNQIRY